MHIKIIICLLLFSTVSVNNSTTDKEILSSFCNLQIEDNVKHGNNTFTEFYYFEIDEEGKPKNVRERKAKFTHVQEVRDCLTKWKLNGFSQDSIFRVEFSWEHGLGWTQMRIINKEYSQTVLNGDKACPKRK